MGLADGLKQKDLPCEASTDGVAVKIEARRTFEPDPSVLCGPRQPEDTIVVRDPIIVVEVLRPTLLRSITAASLAAISCYPASSIM
jgi:Uma2 family endonuclease